MDRNSMRRAVAIDPYYRTRFLFMSGDLVRDTTQSFVSSLNCPCLAKPFALQILFQHLAPHLEHLNSPVGESAADFAAFDVGGGHCTAFLGVALTGEFGLNCRN